VHLLERLNGGGTWRAGTLIAEHTAAAVVDGADPAVDPEGVRALLEELVAFGALAVAR
jgi:hypothetical protein